jgi:hypothetical protein
MIRAFSFPSVSFLIVGPMPTNGIQFPPPPSGFRLAMTFDVTGNNVIAGGLVVIFATTSRRGSSSGFGAWLQLSFPKSLP